MIAIRRKEKQMDGREVETDKRVRRKDTSMDGRMRRIYEWIG